MRIHFVIIVMELLSLFQIIPWLIEQSENPILILNKTIHF